MDKVRREHPEMIQIEQSMEAQMKEGLKHINLPQYAAKGTNATTLPIDPSTFIYDIPIVVHVIHDYGTTDYLTDDAIFNAVKEWNIVYAGANADTADVIPTFKPYIGNPRIRLHLATKDPDGNPTKGITHHQSYLSTVGGDQAKYDQWPNNAYVNIWFVASFLGQPVGLSGLLAYAVIPSAAQIPAEAPYDGVICKSVAMLFDKTINHEVGHIFNLYHPWGPTNDPEIACGDDGVDDTPPTKGHWSCNTSDTACATGYFKHYFLDSLNTIDTLIDYPDTANTQNTMDYSGCAKMFTKGQVYRMHQTLNLDVANRNHLWSPANLAATGALLPMQDLNPIPDFSVERGKPSSGIPPTERTYFYCANDAAIQFGFINRSWNDTITQVKWHFSNGATTPDVTSTSTTLSTAVYNSFSQPGWVTVGMEVTGNGATATTTSSTQAVYAADGANPIVVNPNYAQYVMEFNPGETDNWPIFNYYNNEFKWQINNSVGYYDHTCMQYTGYDSRVFNALGHYPTGSPGGDFDDFFTPAFDLTAMTTGNCNLNFMSAGTFRTGNTSDMKDSLFISYSTNCGRSWTTLKALGKHDLANNGTLTIAYAPLWMGEWALQSIDIPAAARTNKTFFRFRYKPGVDANEVSTGNNFFLDRINIGNFPLGLNTLVGDNHKIAVAPNPTTGNSYVIINGINNGTANVEVTDVTGRVVYSTSHMLSANVERIEIPASALQVKGIYMVHVKTDTQTFTEKLVSY